MDSINEPKEYEEISIQNRLIVENWIKKNIQPRKTELDYSSYGLKHLFEYDSAEGGFYMSNGAFKGAMLACGFNPVIEHTMNCTYCISKKSPAFKKGR